MLAIKLAFKNLLGAGLRTWLNVAVLSFAYVIMVFFNGMLDGWNQQARRDTIEWEINQGQFWHPQYDKYDILGMQEANGPLSSDMLQMVEKGLLSPQLFTQATVYPQGRMLNIILKGIDPDQQMIQLPTSSMLHREDVIPAIIGKRFAKQTKLKENDQVLIRWRDKNGTFDAREITIVDVFDCNVQAVDMGQIWIPLQTLQQMTGLENHATLLLASENAPKENLGEWMYKDHKFLLHELDEVIATKKISSSITYLLLLAIALLAIFDTQVLSIFRRQKEIGTYIALGMTRWQVIKIFTVEGSAHSILALVVASIYGIPLFALLNKTGIPMPAAAEDAGITISEKIIPAYSAGMLITSILLVIASATIVSYFPTRKISKLKPTDALKGKLQ